MFKARMVSLVLVAAISGCSVQSTLPDSAPKPDSTPNVPSRTIPTNDFALEVIERMGSTPAKCDAYAIADRSTDWTCAAYSDGYEMFIKQWELVAATPEFRNRYSLSSTSDWLYFTEKEEVDFYARSYRVGSTQAMIAHDPSEKGRELFIGINPNLTLAMAQADGRVSALDLPANELTGPQKNAVRSAKNYLGFKGFSKAGLISQLSSEYGDGYSVADAIAAVNTLDVDWREQAVRSAKNYLSFKGFSCNGLIDQLSSSYGDKYTLQEATYGARQTSAC